VEKAPGTFDLPIASAAVPLECIKMGFCRFLSRSADNRCRATDLNAMKVPLGPSPSPSLAPLNGAAFRFQYIEMPWGRRAALARIDFFSA
jgi:hypothetical protein